MALIDQNQEAQEEFAPEPTGTELNADAASEARTELLTKILRQVHESIGHVLELLEGGEFAEGERKLAELVTTKKQLSNQVDDISGARVLEGVFDGSSMIGPDGKAYSVPPNYASKSRLVEGDVMKLTIKTDGSFLFKQIGPVERKRVKGTVAFDASTSSYVAISDGATYKLLTASVTYFKGQPGDEVVMLVPKSGRSVWASVENVIKK